MANNGGRFSNRIGVAHFQNLSVYERTKNQILKGQKITGDPSQRVLVERVMRYITEQDLWDQLPPPYEDYD